MKLEYRENILVFQSPRTLSGGVGGEMHALCLQILCLAIIPYDLENVLATSVSVGLDSFWNNTCENKHQLTNSAIPLTPTLGKYTHHSAWGFGYTTVCVLEVLNMNQWSMDG